jgi:uncharacterized protein YodC (DUF2158 family)
MSDDQRELGSRNNVVENHKQIREGDVVQFSLGGRKLTVLKLDGDGAECRWLAGSQEQTVWVSFACVKKVGRLPQVTIGHDRGNLLLSGVKLLRMLTGSEEKVTKLNTTQVEPL